MTMGVQRPSTAGLEALAAVAQHGSISAAARALGLAQPTVSAALARLEQQAGCPLVRRSPAGGELTPAGAEVLELTTAALTALDEVASALARLKSGGDTAPVQVAASYTVAEHLLPVWLGGTDVPTQVQVRNSEEVQREVLAGTVELGFIEGTTLAAGLNARVVATDELVLVVSPQHPWAGRREPVSAAHIVGMAASETDQAVASGPGGGDGAGGASTGAGGTDTDKAGKTGDRKTRDVAAAPSSLVVREPGSGARQVLERALSAHGCTLPAEVTVMGSNAAVLTAVSRAGAHAVLAEEAASAALASGSVVRVPTAMDLRRELRLVTRGRLSRGAQALVAACPQVPPSDQMRRTST